MYTVSDSDLDEAAARIYSGNSIMIGLCLLSTLSSPTPNYGYCIGGYKDCEELERVGPVADGLVWLAW